jgi:hypothetical protein
LISSLTITSSCKKNAAPVPDQQELITTIKIQMVEEFSSFMQTFQYKVENGFGGTAGTISIDTLKLKPNTKYDVVLVVLNEKANPVENITTEILEKDNEHLFVFASNPNSGNGSVAVSAGNFDKNGLPLNQSFKLSTSTAGSGTFKITLMHNPTNKNGLSPETAGGETDLDATFPVVLQ